MPERFEIYIVYKRRYINTLPFLSLPVVAEVTECGYLNTISSATAAFQVTCNGGMTLKVTNGH